MYIQTTYESCLAVNLFYNLWFEIDKQKEFDVLNYSLNFSKESFTLWHLEYFCRKYGSKFHFYVDNSIYRDFLLQIPVSKNIFLSQKKVNLNFIDTLLESWKVILYVDWYYLYKVVHYPHFITLISKSWENYEIYDSWDGEVKILPKNLISKSIISLRNHLKFSPQVIQI